MTITQKIKFYVENILEKILQFKYRNKPYINYYQAVMKLRARLDPKTATGGEWEQTGLMQVDRLKRYGMCPEHTLFDIGCGALRGGRHLIKFLDTGNYFENDISSEILKEAEKILTKEKLETKKPHLFLTQDHYFNEVSGRKFDYIQAQSVLSHMPPEDIESLFRHVSKMMHPRTQFLATFFLSKDDTIYDGSQRKNFFYPIEWMKKVGEKNGLLVTMPETNRKQKLMHITLLPRE